MTKNQTLNKINELHKKLDCVDNEISITREKIMQQQKAHQMDYSTANDTFISQASSNNINRLLREVEEIKSAVKVSLCMP